ncbi:uncharacterized protein LOC27208446 [Drosophila simulans]|uniref:MD-2-related lipid-recognition domain-containing protein n=1 Tax=Drosophila simulans TaxID=7240 RepID=A0A0J9RZ24_DROSI|nr:uncharacterized protein LOC27208446 [Drosophila simulans]KMZ00843.1 uncharacterized protein Dsimw501_GD28599 [Drosophila simulans]
MLARFSFFVIFLPLQFGLAKNNYDIAIKTLSCQIIAKKYVNSLECLLVRPRIAMVSVKFSLNQTIEHFDVLATFDLMKKDKSRMNIADIKMDGCKYLGSMYQNNIVGKLLKRLKSVSNLPASCPVLKGKLYEIRNYTFNSDEFPPGAPQAKWQVRLKLLKRSELVADISIEGAVVYNT